jgi:Sulfatase
MNRFAAILVIVVLVFRVGPDLPGAVANALRERARVTVAPVSDLPDIYVLLLDGYPRADVLERRFGIDNSPFLDELRDLGFDVASASHANYVFTQLTLASMFQMRHLEEIPELAPLIGTPGWHVNALRDALIDSPAFATLRAAGYQIVATQPGYEHVALRNAADRVLEHGEMNDLERDVLKRTWLLDPLGALMPTFFTCPPRDRVVHAFDDLVRLADEDRGQPTFTWVHVPAPHLPLALDADGQALPLDPRRFDASDVAGFGMSDAQFATAYAGELNYLNGRVLDAVRALEIAPGRREPVIVILSDHGYTYDLADVQARLGNFFAAFTPQAPALLAEPPTLVNLMPILFNRFLGTHDPMSADRYFLSPGGAQMLELTEVPDPH